jgi:hypothetical protein
MTNGTGKKIISSTSVVVAAAVVVAIFLPVIALGAMLVGQLSTRRRKNSIVD